MWSTTSGPPSTLLLHPDPPTHRIYERVDFPTGPTIEDFKAAVKGLETGPGSDIAHLLREDLQAYPGGKMQNLRILQY